MARLLMVPDDEDVMADQAALKAQNPGRIVAIRLRATPAAAQRVLELARQGAEVVHLVFDSHGRETAPVCPGGHPLAGRVPPDGTRSVPNTCVMPATCCAKSMPRWPKPASATKSR